MAASATTTSIEQMILNIGGVLPSFVQMVTAFSYVLGLYFMIAGINKLKVFAEMKSMAATGASIKGPLIMMLAGVALLYFPSMLIASIQTLFNTNSLLAYPVKTTLGSDIVGVVIQVVQLIGAIAFIRGWVLVTHLSGQQAPPNTFAKAMTHIIGGIFAMNIYQVWVLLKATVTQ